MLKGNKAIVTGASRGIGFAIAKELAQNGCKIVITGRNKETLKATADKIGGNVIPHVWDAADIDLAEAKIKEAADLLARMRRNAMDPSMNENQISMDDALLESGDEAKAESEKQE